MTRPIDKASILVYTENVEFDWDPKKAASNRKKHKISFELAITVFDDPHALIAVDEIHSTNHEAREWIVGLSDDGVLVVVFTKRFNGKVYRIISARKANRKERIMYEKFKKLSF